VLFRDTIAVDTTLCGQPAAFPMFMHVQHILNDALQSDDKYLQPVSTAGSDSSVGTEIRHELDGPGIEARLRGDFPHLSCTMGTWFLSRG
jgi:hypothetical protein